jgi:hypothetical protein
MKWWPLKPGNRIYASGFALYVLSGFLPFWFDAAQLWHKEISGFRMFTRSIVLAIAFLGGNPQDIAFSVYNVLILLTTPVLIVSPYLLAGKTPKLQPMFAVAVLQLATACWGLLLIQSKYPLRYGFPVWILSLIIMVTGLAAHSRKSVNE